MKSLKREPVLVPFAEIGKVGPDGDIVGAGVNGLVGFIVGSGVAFLVGGSVGLFVGELVSFKVEEDVDS